MNNKKVNILPSHLDCPYYQSKDSPVFEIINHRKGVEISQKMDKVALVFVTEGEIAFSFDSNTDLTARYGDFFMLPVNTDFTAVFKESGSLLYFYVPAENDICWRVVHRLSGYSVRTSTQNIVLSSTEIIQNHIRNFLMIAENGILCLKYLNAQIFSLLELLCMLYPLDTLAEFFEPLRSYTSRENAHFKEVILQNRNKLFKVSDFAAAVYMSRSTFRRYFERTFGMNPQEWITQERVKLIEQELKYGTLPLRRIAMKAGFLSVREFYGYCQKKFGKTATEIRNEG
jgi:AraC-like DNA-binding protein